MLVISRHKHEALRIKTASGEIAWIVVTEFLKGKVRLGIIADRSINVARSEILPADEQYQHGGVS